jgi:predicted  nucleic acid-binding Zn-ribbon protein
MLKNELDFYGRLLSIEQALKSLEGRIRGVEYRLSFEDEKNKQAVIESEMMADDLKKLFDSITGKIFAIEELLKDLNNSRAKLLEEIKGVQVKIQELEKQIFELQMQKKPAIKIPMDMTGIVAAACMLIITALLATNNSSILQYPAFSMTIGLAFILAVASRLLHR